MTLVALTLSLVLADMPPPAECSKDSQCQLTTFAGCCGACCPTLSATPKGKNEQAECKTRNCAPLECATKTCEPAPDASRFVAACVARQCRAIRKDAQCRVESDCVLVEDAAPADTTCTKASCCCPVMVAVPNTSRAPAKVPPGARCAECPGQPYSYPACIEGRCQSVVWTAKSKKR